MTMHFDDKKAIVIGGSDGMGRRVAIATELTDRAAGTDADAPEELRGLAALN
jgi:hypothetical protein